MASSDNQAQGASAQQTYRFKVTVGEKDLSNDIYMFNIVTSVQLPYQTFEVGFTLDQNDLSLEKIYGQEPIKISVILETEAALEIQATDFELIFLSVNNVLTSQVNSPADSDTQQVDRIKFSFMAISKKAYATMNHYINDVFHAYNLSEILTSIVEKTGAQLILDFNGINTTTIKQILIPPSTLYQTFSYLNQLFGLYDGVSAYFCSHDNKVNIKNLTKKITSSDAFTIYQLSLNSEEDVLKDSKPERTYINWGNVQSSYKGNSVIAAITPTLRYILKPSDRLFHKTTIGIDEFTKKCGIVDKENQIFYDKTTLKIDKRMATYISQTGNELSEVFINSSLSKHISELATLNMTIIRNFYVLSFMNVGEAVNFVTQIDQNVSLSGKYILKSSLIEFSKISSWEAAASISLIRSNKTTN